MLRGALAFGVAALLAVSCAPTTIEIEDDRAGQPLELAEDEALTFVALSKSIPEDLVACVEGSLGEQAPDLTIVPSRQFRDSLFPWFEPSTAPRSDSDLVALMGRPAVLRRIEDLGLRYVVSLTGGSETVGNDGWGGCAGGYAAVACVGGAGIERKTDLTAAILDLTARRSVGEVTATGSGTFEAGLILLVPYILVTSTEADTCLALAHRVGALIAGTSSHSEESVGE
jgi:hypothetical protein